MSLRRNFRITEQLNLQLRADAFSIFNHPNFADPIGVLPDPNFGRPVQMLSTRLAGLSPLYQIGGPRSLSVGCQVPVLTSRTTVDSLRRTSRAVDLR